MSEKAPGSAARDEPCPLATCRYCLHETINTHDRVCAVCAHSLSEAASLPSYRLGAAEPGVGSVRTDLRALLGEQLWLATADAGMTQGDLADALGMSAKHVSFAVRGMSGSPEFFDRAARLLGRTWEVRLV